MFVQRLGVPEVDAGEEIALLGHGQLAEDLVYVDVSHVGCLLNRVTQVRTAGLGADKAGLYTDMSRRV